jgi:hypothetical protein
VDKTPELLRLPRSVLLAIWLDGVGTAGVTVRDLLKAVQGDDEPHAVRGPDDFGPAGSGLADLVAAWAGGPRAVTAVVATPEDPYGLPADVVEAIGAAEGCVLIEFPDGAYAAVPEVVRFGSVFDQGHVVSWDVHPIEPWHDALGSGLGGLTDAEREIRRALTIAKDNLATMDLGLWGRPAAATAAALSSVRDLRWALPPYVDGRRRRILVKAIRLRAIVTLACDTDGGGVDLWSDNEPAATFRAVHRAARLAISAAVLSVRIDVALRPQD